MKSRVMRVKSGEVGWGRTRARAVQKGSRRKEYLIATILRGFWKFLEKRVCVKKRANLGMSSLSASSFRRRPQERSLLSANPQADSGKLENFSLLR